jgi:hypothetical protein
MLITPMHQRRDDLEVPANHGDKALSWLPPPHFSQNASTNAAPGLYKGIFYRLVRETNTQKVPRAFVG